MIFLRRLGVETQHLNFDSGRLVESWKSSVRRNNQPCGRSTCFRGCLVTSRCSSFLGSTILKCHQRFDLYIFFSDKTLTSSKHPPFSQLPTAIMKSSITRLATATTAGASPGLRRAPAALLPPIQLYRRVLRANRKLPAEMRVLGDNYVKSEFHQHQKVDNPLHIVRLQRLFV